MGLKKRELTKLKNKIIEEKERIQASSFIDADGLEVKSDQVKDESDVANAEFERSRMLRFRNRDLFYAKKLEAALVKIADNEYGECEDCGDDIKFERLMARPTAELCIVCKDESERSESASFLGTQSKSHSTTFNSAKV